jgi:hypothetical protein
MKSNVKYKNEESEIDRGNEIMARSLHNRKQMELRYLIPKQWKESLCLIIHCLTIAFIMFLALLFAWVIYKLGLADFLKDFARFQTEINFDSIKNGVVLPRSIKIPTEILILITIFIWRFSPLAFFKKDSKDKSE